MQRFLKIVGNGRKSARDLSSEEAEEAFENLALAATA